VFSLFGVSCLEIGGVYHASFAICNTLSLVECNSSLVSSVTFPITAAAAMVLTASWNMFKASTKSENLYCPGFGWLANTRYFV